MDSKESRTDPFSATVTTRVVAGFLISLPVTLVAVTIWLANPTAEKKPLPPQLIAAESGSVTDSVFAKDATALERSYESQAYRSFCGPASLATVLRAFGQNVDQRDVFPSIAAKAKVFYSGINLQGLSQLAEQAGVTIQLVYADAVSQAEFTRLIKDNLSREGDYVLVNYDRRALGQEGSGHISPIAAYDSSTDAFLVLDEAGYKYPFTWVPATMLYSAARTIDGDHYRGLLFASRLPKRD